MTREAKAIGCAAAAVLSWSTVATAFKMSLRYFNNYEMLLVASLTALCIFLADVTVRGHWRLVPGITRRQWMWLILMGLVNPTAYYLVLFKAYDLLPAQIAQPINYAWPIVLLVLLAVIGHRRITKGKYLGMGISLCGVAVISLGGASLGMEGINAMGLGLAALSAVLWATYWIINDQLSGKLDPSLALAIGFAVGTTILWLGILFAPEDPGFLNNMASEGTGILSSILAPVNLNSVPGVLSSIYVGCFEIGIPFLFFGAALRLTSNPALINQMCYLSPFLSLFIISMVLGESIAFTTYLGLALIVAGLAFNSLLDRRSAPASGTTLNIDT